VSSKGRRRRPSSKTLAQALKCDDEAFLDFIARCLRWDPERRLRPDEAMHHEFITGIKSKGPAGGARTRSHNGVAVTGRGSGHQSSPVKRLNTSQTPQRGGVREVSASGRPLPEPPATSFRNGNPVSSRQQHRDVSMPMTRASTSSSPVKGHGAGRRHSTMNSVGSASGIKKSSNSMGIAGVAGAGNSALPRVAGGPGVGYGGSHRSVSGKPDLASAAAVASLNASSGMVRGPR